MRLFSNKKTLPLKRMKLHITKLTRCVRSTSLGLRHIAQKAAQRRVSKTLAAIAFFKLDKIYTLIYTICRGNSNAKRKIIYQR